MGWLLLACWTASAQATGLTLEQSLAAAERYSAELSANQHQVNALQNMADSAMELPDPKLKFGIENVPVQGSSARRLTRDGMTMERVGIMQDYVSSTKRQRKATPYGPRPIKPKPAVRRSAPACSSRRHKPGWSWR